MYKKFIKERLKDFDILLNNKTQIDIAAIK